MKRKTKNIVVGCGFSGATIAERIASVLNEEVLIIEKKDHIAGNSFDYIDENGIHIQKHGPHIFHTNNAAAWEYLSSFTDWNDYVHEVKAVVAGKEIPIPFNLNSIQLCFPSDKALRLERKLIESYGEGKKVPILNLRNDKDHELKELAEFVYKNVFLNYSVKQWGATPEELDPSVSSRVPVTISRDDRYFHDKYQGIPVDGYTRLIEEMISNPLIKIELRTDFSSIRDNMEYDKLFFTGPIDEYFGYRFGELPYRSCRFDLENQNAEYYQDNSVINFPNENDYTRITEFKYFLNEKAKNTVIAKEYPKDFAGGNDERYYPVPKNENAQKYALYKKDASLLKNVFFLGRLGDYSYYNMDKAVERAIELFESVRK